MTTRTRLALLLPLLLLLPLSAASAQIPREEKAKLALVADRTAYAPGEEARIGVVMTIEEEWHTNSHEPTYDWLIPTDAELTLPEGWPGSVVDYPDGVMKRFAFTEGPISVYDGTVLFVAGVPIPEGANPGEVAISAFYADIGIIINTVSIIAQFFLFSFIVRRFGITTALLITPAAMLISSGVYFAIPVLWAGSMLTISDNSLSYSLNQTSRETLFVPTDPDVKYKARAFANMFVQRFGKGIAILMAMGLAAFPIRFLSLLAAIVIALWAGFAWYAGKRFDEQTGDDAERPFQIDRCHALRGDGPVVFAQAVRAQPCYAEMVDQSLPVAHALQGSDRTA